MTDFAAMAAKAKAERDARAADEAQKAELAKRERDAFVDNAIAKLEEHVLPVLERARADFSNHGIESKIVKSYDVRSTYSKVNPSLKFSCFSPKRSSDGYQMETPSAFFSCDGENVLPGLGNAPYDREPKRLLGMAPVGDGEKLVSQAIENLVTSYFEMLETNKHVLK
jgi:hypothetical protein